MVKSLKEVLERSKGMLEGWARKPSFESHLALIERAIMRYQEKDYISATAILYPRIEGIMRSHHLESNTSRRATQQNLTASVIEASGRNTDDFSLLLPLRFRRYLEEVYFANFNPQEPATLSRNSVAHGVANPEDYSLKGATIGLLILDQMFYYLPTPTELPGEKEQETKS